jgi:hypothetical protein
MVEREDLRGWTPKTKYVTSNVDLATPEAAGTAIGE